jgi:hypothetical protein
VRDVPGLPSLLDLVIACRDLSVILRDPSSAR